MARFPCLSAIVVLASYVLATPLVTIDKPNVSLPFTTRFNLTSGIKLADFDRARAKSFIRREAARSKGSSKQKAAVVNVPVTNAAVQYLATVGVGSPPTNYSLIIDTGSSNTWVGATQPYVKTSTSQQTEDLVAVMYGSGFFFGEEFVDQVTLSPDLIVPNQSIGVAFFSDTFQGTDGILGVGPADLTFGTLSPNTDASIPTVTDNLFAQGAISSNSIGISFEPTTSLEVTNGEMTFGGTDSTKFTGNISFAPITSTPPSSEFWGIDQRITYGNGTPILNLTAGIVDTGTTLLLIATDAMEAYAAATGAVFDDATGLFRVTNAQRRRLQSLFFHINGVTFEFTANAQLWPRALNTAIGGVEGANYLIVGDLGSPSGEGFDFVNGYAFLERFYSVYDTGNGQVGFATTHFTRATTN